MTGRRVAWIVGSSWGSAGARCMVCVGMTRSCWCYCFFFFSSRRRHTRFDCDWSSDVCSSDLPSRRVTAGFYVWVLLSLGEMVEVGLIAVAARRHGEGLPDAAARAAGAAVLYALDRKSVV